MKKIVVLAFTALFTITTFAQTLAVISTTACLPEKQRIEFERRMRLLESETIESAELQLKRRNYHQKLKQWSEALSLLVACESKSAGLQGQCSAEVRQLATSVDEKSAAEAKLQIGSEDEKYMQGLIKLRSEFPPCP